MTGAEFTLTNTNGERVVLVAEEVFEEDPDGEYWKLKDGTYTTDDPTTEGMDTSLYEDTQIKYTKKTQLSGVKLPDGSHSISGEVDADGKVVFKGLGTGKYVLSETKVPKGYIKIDDIEFYVGFEVDGLTYDHPSPIDGDGKPVFANPRFFIADEDGNEVEAGKSDIVLGENSCFEATIKNIPGVRLPGVGGSGTVPFYVIGGILVVGAAAWLIIRRRMKAE